MSAMPAFGSETELARPAALRSPRIKPSVARTRADADDSSRELRRLRDALRDEARRREAAEQALAVERRQHASERARIARLSTAGEMAGALAHQLAQPLAATLNYLQGCQLRLAGGNASPETLQHALALAVEQVQQAGGIVAHVRNFVARHEPDTKAVDLHALIRQTLAVLERDCRAHGIALLLELADSAPQASADPLEIQQVLLNLMRNAIDAMTTGDQPQRVLTIGTRIDGATRRVEIVVADSGPGIKAADLPRIFDSWYTTKRHGLGLGLSVCRTIVESHGGQLRVDNGSTGGALFRFDLSLVNQA